MSERKAMRYQQYLLIYSLKIREVSVINKTKEVCINSKYTFVGTAGNFDNSSIIC